MSASLAKIVMQRCAALAQISDERGRLTRTFASPGMRHANKLVGSWIGVWGGKVVTGWHFLDPQPWAKVEGLFGTHEAKYQLKGWV